MAEKRYAQEPWRVSMPHQGRWPAVGIKSANGRDIADVWDGAMAGPEEVDANARLIAAAPETLDAATGLNALIVKAQQLLARYIVPDSDISEYDVIDQLLYIFDGPEQRAAQQKWAEALAKAVTNG